MNTCTWVQGREGEGWGSDLSSHPIVKPAELLVCKIVCSSIVLSHVLRQTGWYIESLKSLSVYLGSRKGGGGVG